MADMVAVLEQRQRLEKRLSREMAPTDDGVAFGIELLAAAPALGDGQCRRVACAPRCLNGADELSPGEIGRLD